MKAATVIQATGDTDFAKSELDVDSQLATVVVGPYKTILCVQSLLDTQSVTSKCP